MTYRQPTHTARCSIQPIERDDMNISTEITKCEVCGDFRGFIIDGENPAQAMRGYCRCEPAGWEKCKRHDGRVRRRFKSIRIDSLDGDYRYFSLYAMLAPCREDTCVPEAS